MALPQSVQPIAAALAPCATTIALPECPDGCISRDAATEILDAFSDNDSVVVGPGLGQGNDLKTVLETIIHQCPHPLLIDADGLNQLAALMQQDFKFNCPVVLTPHPGEMQRLWKTWFRQPLPEDRTTQAEQLALKTSAIVVLKGNATVVTDGEHTYINDTGNPGLASGGSGDVLSGCIGALLALGGKDKVFSPLDAAILGVWAHGKAGDVAAEKFGQTGLLASDLPEFIGKILDER